MAVKSTIKPSSQDVIDPFIYSCTPSSFRDVTSGLF